MSQGTDSSVPNNYPSSTSQSIDDSYIVLGGGGMQGPPGAAVELRTTETELQWRSVGGIDGTTDWMTLSSLAELATHGVAPALTPGTTKILQWFEPATAELVKDGPGAYHIDFGIPAGQPGPKGQPRFTGQGPPDVTPLGAVPGDLYMDTETGVVYQLG